MGLIFFFVFLDSVFFFLYNIVCADVAQAVEHFIGNEEVGSSSLLISSTERSLCQTGMVCAERSFYLIVSFCIF